MKTLLASLALLWEIAFVVVVFPLVCLLLVWFHVETKILDRVNPVKK